MRIPRLVVALALGFTVVPWWAATPAGADTTFTCVVGSTDPDSCVVTIQLTSAMDEAITSTMPDSQPWFANDFAGNCPSGTGSYQISNQTWDGGSSSQGHVWAAQLTTGTVQP